MAKFISNIFLVTKGWGKKVPWLEKAITLSNEILFVPIAYFIFALQDIYPFNLVLIGLVGLFSVLTVLYCFLYGTIIFDRYVLMIVLFVAIQLLSTAVNGFKTFSKNGLLMGMMSIVIYEWTKQKEGKGKKLLLATTLGGLIFIVHFIIVYRNSLFSLSSRLGSYFGNENDIGRHLAIITLLFVVFAYQYKDIYSRIAGIFFSIISFYLMALTGSVSNLLVVSFLLYFFAVWLIWKKNRKISLAVAVAIPLLAIGILFLPFMEYYRGRLSDMFASLFSGTSSGDDSFNWRLKASMYALRIWISNPLLGGGYGAVYSSYLSMSHNNIAEILASFGIFALIIEEVILFLPLFKDRLNTPSVFLVVSYIIIFQLFLVSYNSKIEQALLPICYSFVSLNLKNRGAVNSAIMEGVSYPN